MINPSHYRTFELVETDIVYLPLVKNCLADTDHCVRIENHGGTSRFVGAGPLRIRPDVS